MKVLIMVLSNTEIPAYDMLKRVQQDTWDSVDVDNVSTVFYYGKERASVINSIFETGRDISVNCSDAYNMMHYKFKLALMAVWNMQWDYIFRTNSCSYIDKGRLLRYATKNPPADYQGRDEGHIKQKKLPYASGCGFFISRLAAGIVLNELTNIPHPYEDVLIGDILRRYNIPVVNRYQRYDVKHTKREYLLGWHYHYRCKSDTDDRMKDVVAMMDIHAKKTTRALPWSEM